MSDLTSPHSHSPESPDSVERSTSLVRWAVLACLIAVIFGPSIGGGPITDDHVFLIQNPVLRDPGGLRQIWTPGSIEDYWPVTYSLFWLWVQLTGGHPAVLRGLLLCLHLVTSMLVGSLARAFLPPARRKQPVFDPGMWASLLFALHPVNVEAAAWMIQTKTVLSTAFTLGSCIAYLRFLEKGHKRAYLATLALHGLGLLSKSSGVFIPVVFGLLHLSKTRTLRGGFALLPAFLVSFLIGSMGLLSHRFQYELSHLDFWTRGALVGHSVLYYARTALFPFGLSFVQANVVTPPVTFVDFLPTLVVVVVSGLCSWNWQSRASTVFLGYLACLLPVLGWIDIPYFRFAQVADHWQYLALGWAVSIGFGGILERRPFARVVIVPLLFVLALSTRNRAILFAEEVELLRHTVQSNPSSGPLRAAFAQALADRGELDRAEGEYEKAVELSPDYATGHLGLAVTRARKGKKAEAERAFGRAEALDPNDPAIPYERGAFLAALGRYAEARIAFERTLELQPANIDALLNLGNVQALEGQPEAARVTFQKAASASPGHPGVWMNLGMLDLRAGALPAAKEHLRRALTIAPGFIPASLALAEALLREGNRAAAVEELEAAKHNVGPGSQEARVIEESLARLKSETR